jgi:hypothetical protein
MTGGDNAVAPYETDEEGDEMPFVEYMLLALLGSGAAIPGETPGGPSPRTFTADAVTQPSGGIEGLLGQATGGSPGKQAGTGRKGRVHTSARHHRRGHRRGKVYESGKKATKS